MGLAVPVTITCDERTCTATVQFVAFFVVPSTKGNSLKIRLDDTLPEGWIHEKDREYYGSTEKVEFFCPVHGKERQPWRY